MGGQGQAKFFNWGDTAPHASPAFVAHYFLVPNCNGYKKEGDRNAVNMAKSGSGC